MALNLRHLIPNVSPQARRVFWALIIVLLSLYVVVTISMAKRRPVVIMAGGGLAARKDYAINSCTSTTGLRRMLEDRYADTSELDDKLKDAQRAPKSCSHRTQEDLTDVNQISFANCATRHYDRNSILSFTNLITIQSQNRIFSQALTELITESCQDVQNLGLHVDINSVIINVDFQVFLLDNDSKIYMLQTLGKLLHILENKPTDHQSQNKKEVYDQLSDQFQQQLIINFNTIKEHYKDDGISSLKSTKKSVSALLNTLMEDVKRSRVLGSSVTSQKQILYSLQILSDLNNQNKSSTKAAHGQSRVFYVSSDPALFNSTFNQEQLQSLKNLLKEDTKSKSPIPFKTFTETHSDEQAFTDSDCKIDEENSVTFNRCTRSYALTTFIYMLATVAIIAGCVILPHLPFYFDKRRLSLLKNFDRDIPDKYKVKFRQSQDDTVSSNDLSSSDRPIDTETAITTIPIEDSPDADPTTTMTMTTTSMTSRGTQPLIRKERLRDKCIYEGLFSRVFITNINGTDYVKKYMNPKEVVCWANRNQHLQDCTHWLEEAILHTKIVDHENIMKAIWIEFPRKATELMIIGKPPTQTDMPSMTFEYMKLGSLDSFLTAPLPVARPSKRSNKKYVTPDKEVVAASKQLRIEDCLDIIEGVARGMKHLHGSNTLHGDLCSRNILITKDRFTGKYVAKITDFGLSTTGHNSPGDYYHLRSALKGDLVPMDIMPPEVVEDASQGRKWLTTACDVWSFGVMTFEIFTRISRERAVYVNYCERNFVAGADGLERGAFDQARFRSCMDKGLRWPKPIECPEDVYRVVLTTWQFLPAKRPSFDGILRMLQAIRRNAGDEERESWRRFLSLFGRDITTGREIRAIAEGSRTIMNQDLVISKVQDSEENLRPATGERVKTLPAFKDFHSFRLSEKRDGNVYECKIETVKS